jgi:hypothetical protein
MKLRILGDTLRLRLSQSDIAELGESGRVEDAIHFGPGASSALTYAVELDDGVDAVAARYGDDRITVRLPTAVGRRWIEGSDVGISGQDAIDADRTLEVLIEKDFKCLAPRPGEEEYDGFPNPDADKATC